MLKKLYKHEFYSLFRSLLPIYAALIGFALLSRFSFLINTENAFLGFVKALSTTFYVFAIISVFAVGLVIVVMRFYKNLLSHEGYLTFTLPFTASEHIVCKLACGTVMMLAGFIAVIASLLILGAGTETLSDIITGLNMAVSALKSNAEAWKIILLGIELTVFILFSAVQSLLMFYAAISIGQQFKNRVGGAVVAYICLYAAVQMLSGIILTLVFTVAGGAEKFDGMINNSVTYLVLMLLSLIVYSAVLSAAYFLISRHFLTKKLNLE